MRSILQTNTLPSNIQTTNKQPYVVVNCNILEYCNVCNYSSIYNKNFCIFKQYLVCGIKVT